MVEFYIFSGLFILSALFSILSKKVLQAIFFQCNSLISMALVLSLVQSSLMAFCLIFLNVNMLVVFIIITSLFFDKNYLNQVEKSNKINIAILITSMIEFVWLLYKNQIVLTDTSLLVDTSDYMIYLYILGVFFLATFVELEFLIRKNKNE
ncbi:MAG: hypothetical protein MJ250_01365 [Alphaproteobacteria bacterium]|nr:hypothetical protein [Alphaproteobacteria bacterium]